MNYEKALETIKKIFDEENDEKVCVHIDGQWGIGKTYTFNKFVKDNNKFNIAYVSLFGKNNLAEIEKDIIVKIAINDKDKKKIEDKAPKVNKFFKEKKNTINAAVNVGSGILGDLAEHFLGIDTNVLKYLSVENIPAKNNIIVCIDDLERKSEEVSLKDILGLVERTTENCNVIIIGNMVKVDQSEVTIFNDFKEKVIDYEIRVDELSNNTLISITKEKLEFLDDEKINNILNIFLGNKYKKNTILNLRIFKKYINLLKRIEDIVSSINPSLNIDEYLVKIAYITIYNHYICEDKEKKFSIVGYMDKELAMEIDNIFKNEVCNIEVFKEYLDEKSEIKNDINKFYNLYKLSVVEANEIMDKINKNIKDKNQEYFIKQKYVVDLYDVFNEIGISKYYKDDLIKVAKVLYKPNIDNKPKKIDAGLYYDEDPYEGITPKYYMNGIIAEINKYNDEEYNKEILNKLDEMINLGEVKGIYDILKYCSDLSIDYFNRIFPVLFNTVIDEYDELTWKTIYRLISAIKYDDIYLIDQTVNKFINKIINKNNNKVGLIKKARFNELKRYIYEHERWRAYEERQYEAEMMELEDEYK